MSCSLFVREFRALANSNLAALPQILNESPAKCVLTVLARSAGFFARHNNPVFGFMTSFLEGARLRRDNRQPETIGNQCRGVLWCLRRQLREESLPGNSLDVRIVRVDLSIRLDSPPSQVMEHGRPPPLIRLHYHLNFIRLKLPRDCQNPVSTAGVDDNDLFLAPGLAKHRVDSSTRPTPRHRKRESGLKQALAYVDPLVGEHRLSDRRRTRPGARPWAMSLADLFWPASLLFSLFAFFLFPPAELLRLGVALGGGRFTRYQRMRVSECASISDSVKRRRVS